MATSKLCSALLQKFIAYASKFLNIFIITLFVPAEEIEKFRSYSLVFILHGFELVHIWNVQYFFC